MKCESQNDSNIDMNEHCMLGALKNAGNKYE